MFNRQENDAPRQSYVSKFGIMASAGAIAVGLTAFDGYYTIGETERGLMYTFSKLTTTDSSQIAQPGFHLKIPFVQSVRKIPVGVNEVTLDNVNIYTRDSQDLDATISYQYQIPESSLIEIAKRLPTNDNIDSIVQNTIMQALKASFGKTEATDVPNERNEVMASATENANNLLFRDWEINVTTINMPNFNFNPIYQGAIAKATEMKAEAERARQEVEKTRAEAASALAKAEGVANAVRTAADANLYATEKAAEGQRLIVSVIGQENAPAYWFTEKWNGIAPVAIGGSNVSLTDLSTAVLPGKKPEPTMP